MNKILFAFILLSIIQTGLFAQSTGFTYQGIAIDQSQFPVKNKKISLKISILSVSAQGNAVYTETQGPTTDNFGQFSVNIGSGTATTGAINNLQWDRVNYFLKVEADITGATNYTLIGISQIYPVPYSLNANSAGPTLVKLDTIRINLSGVKILKRNDSLVLSTNNSGMYIQTVDSLYRLLDEVKKLQAQKINFDSIIGIINNKIDSLNSLIAWQNTSSVKSATIQSLESVNARNLDSVLMPSVYFDGFNTHISLGKIDVLSQKIYNRSFTVEAWVKSLKVSDTAQYIICNGYQWNGNVGAFGLSLFKNRVIATVGNFSGYSIAADFPNDSLWHHVVFQHNNNTKFSNIFIDGVEKYKINNSGGQGMVDGSAAIDGIGANLDLGVLAPREFFKGNLRKIRISKGLIYTTDFNPSYRYGKSDSTLAFWELNEGSGTKITCSDTIYNGILYNGTWQKVDTAALLKIGLKLHLPFDGNANDTSGNGLNGVVTGAKLATDRFGNINRAYSFDTLQFIEIPKTENLNPYPMTLSFWAFVDSSKQSSLGSFINKYIPASWNGLSITTGANADGSTINIYPFYLNGGKVPNGLIGGYGQDEKIFTIDKTNIGKWFHFVMLVDSSSGRLYLNGKFYSSTTWRTPPTAFSNNLTWIIGGRYERNNPSDKYFKGKIDDVRIWERPLSDPEIYYLYGLPTTSSIDFSSLVLDTLSENPINVRGVIKNNSSDKILNKGIIFGTSKDLILDSAMQVNTYYTQKLNDSVANSVMDYSSGGFLPSSGNKIAWQMNGVPQIPKANNGYIIINPLKDSFNVNIVGTYGNTTYYVRPYVKTVNDIYYGESKAVKTSNYKRDPRSNDISNVFWKSDFNLFDLQTDEIIKPDSSGNYLIWYSTNESLTVNSKSVSAANLATQVNYKFKSKENCQLWVDYRSGKIKPTDVSQQNSTNLSTGLVAYYPFNGNANDSSGNNNHGTVNGATLTTDRFGENNKAYNFDGSNDYIKTTFNAIQKNEKRSISIWFKTNQLHALVPYPGFPNDQMCLISYGSPQVGGMFDCSLNYNCEGVTLDINNGVFTRPAKTTDNNWHNLVYVSSGSNNQLVDIYFDGVKLNSLNFCLGPGKQDINTGNTWQMTIGSYANETSRFFKGQLDDIRIYNRALDSSDILTLYNSEKPDPFVNGLVAYYPFTGNANDSSGNANNGIVSGAVLTTDRFGNSNAAYDFNGSNSFIDITNKFYNNGWDSSSISLWFKPKVDTNALGQGMTLLNTAPHNGEGIGFSYNKSKRIYHWKGNANGVWDIFQNRQFKTTPITTGIWYNMMIVKKGLNYTYYVNGKEDTTFNITSAPQKVLCSMRIGAISNGAANSEIFNGAIDDIRIYNRTLDTSEISQLYNAEAKIDLKSGLVAYYPFTGNANDSSGNGNNGVVSGATLSSDRFGNSNSSYYFSNSFIRTTNPGPLGKTARSISFWSKAASNYTGNGFVLSYGSNNSGGSEFGVRIDNLCGNAANIDINLSTTSNKSSQSIPNGEWHHYVLTYTPDDGPYITNIKFYVDGNLVTTPCGQNSATLYQLNTLAEEPLTFGRWCDLANSQGGGYYFTGNIDDIRIYNRVLTNDEIKYLSSN